MIDNSYKELVYDLINTNSVKTIACSSNDTYLDVLENIFKHAFNEVVWLIYDESQMEFITRNVMNLIVDYLSNGKKLFLYINKRYPDGKFGQFRASLMSNYENNFVYKKINEIISNDGIPVEFIVFDKQGYRFKPDAFKCPAIFCAKDEIFASKLINAVL